MTYQVEVDFCPAYELVQSLGAFTQKNMHKTMELGPAWVKEVKARLTADFTEELSQKWEHLDASLGIAYLLIWKCPVERTAESFLQWLTALSAGELYERLAPYEDTVTFDLASVRDKVVHLLTLWHQQYFQHFDLSILQALDADAQIKSELSTTMPAEDLVEHATNGLRHNATDGLQRVVLVPSYHNRPFALSLYAKGLILCRYPVDAPAASPDQPSLAMLRLTRSLSDESRLRILHFLAAKSRTFTEVVQHSGLAKSTVHHHMVALRAAGLIHVIGTGPNSIEYRLRLETVQELSNMMLTYFTQTDMSITY